MELFFCGFFCQVKGVFLVISTQSNQSRLLLKSFFFPGGDGHWFIGHQSLCLQSTCYFWHNCCNPNLFPSTASVEESCHHTRNRCKPIEVVVCFPFRAPIFHVNIIYIFCLIQTQTNIIFQFAHCACQEKVQHSSCSKRCTQIRNSKFQVDVGLFGLAPASQRKEW